MALLLEKTNAGTVPATVAIVAGLRCTARKRTLTVQLAVVGGTLASDLGFERLGWAGVPFVALALVVLWPGPTLQASHNPAAKERTA